MSMYLYVMHHIIKLKMKKHPASYRLRKKPQKQLELNGKERQANQVSQRWAAYRAPVIQVLHKQLTAARSKIQHSIAMIILFEFPHRCSNA